MLLEGTVKPNYPMDTYDLFNGIDSYYSYFGEYFFGEIKKNTNPNTGPDISNEIPVDVPKDPSLEHMPNFFWRDTRSHLLMGTIVNEKFDGRLPKILWKGITYYPIFGNTNGTRHIMWSAKDFGPKFKLTYENINELSSIDIFNTTDGYLTGGSDITIIYNDELAEQSSNYMRRFKLEASRKGRLAVNDNPTYGDIFFYFSTYSAKSIDEIVPGAPNFDIRVYPSKAAEEQGAPTSNIQFIYDLWIEKEMDENIKPVGYSGFFGSGELFPIYENEYRFEFPKVFVGAPIWNMKNNDLILFKLINLNLSKIYPKKRPAFVTNNKDIHLIITKSPSEHYVLNFNGYTYVANEEKPKLDKAYEWVFHYKKDENDPNAPSTMDDIILNFFTYYDDSNNSGFFPAPDKWYDADGKFADQSIIDEKDPFYYKWTFENPRAIM